MVDQSGPLTWSWLSSCWERLIAVHARDEEDDRLGRLFNTLMVISLGVCAAISVTVLSMPPLGMLAAKVSWIAAAFPLLFVPLAFYCIANAKRGRIQPMVRLYVWANFAAICAAVLVFDGTRSPIWLLFAWNIAIAGILLAPVYALRLTAAVLGYFLSLELLARWGIYAPLFTFGTAGREFLGMSIIWTILVSTIGLLTWLNMRSLHETLGNLRDEITARRQTEDQLRQSEERYRSVVNNAGDIIFTLSSDGTYLSLNPAFEKISGWPVDEWLGKSFTPLLPQEDLPRAFEVLKKTLREEAVSAFELPIKKKNGDYFTGEFIVAPLKQGESVILLGICRDITERKQIAEALSESEHRYRAIFDIAPDGIITTDLDGKITSLNPAVEKIIGWTPAEYLGTSYSQWVHREDLISAMSAFQVVVAGQLKAVETRIKAASGEFRLLDVTATPRIEHGKMVGALAFFRDVTERRRMEDQIRKLNQELELKVQERTQQLLRAQEELVRKEKLALLGQVAGSVGHELRNPLGVMSNAVYYLQTVLADADEPTREYLKIIRDEITGSERIVSDLLDSVRTKLPHPEAVGVAEMIELTLTKLSVPASVSVKLDIPPALPPLHVDAMQMHQVFRNLISNGVEAMPAGGVLLIKARAHEAGAKITISVRDTGIGIAPENLDKIFQPLFTTKARGIGLGLVVVKNLIEANSGRVEVQSEPGKGTTFAVTLPGVRPTQEAMKPGVDKE